MLLDVGVAQTPATTSLCFGLAARLSYGEEVALARSASMEDSAASSRAALATVRATITERGW